MIGNGFGTSFWLDKWVGNGRLCDRFPRLFQLEDDKKAMVGSMGRWGEGMEVGMCTKS